METTSGLAVIRRDSRAGLPGAAVPLLVLIAVLAGSGCGAQDSASRRPLTQRQRDSTLGRSVIPGAGVVTKALERSDQASSAARSLDAQVDSLGR